MICTSDIVKLYGTEMEKVELAEVRVGLMSACPLTVNAPLVA